ncbi:MAG: hypothetical protein AB7N76_26485 [Planctomycetota bacterium]
MNDPDVRVVVQGLGAAERRLARFVRQRRLVERQIEDARRALMKADRSLARLEQELRRLARG